MKKQFTIFLILIFVFGIISVDFSVAQAVSLSKTEIEVGEEFSIYGDNFGSSVNDYCYICFNDNSSCFSHKIFSSSNYLSWSNTRINLIMPTWADVSGDIIISIKGEEQICYEYLGYCETYPITKEIAKIRYKIKPKITETNPSSIAKSGDVVTIAGKGFGDFGGSVYFDNSIGRIINWSSKTIEVEIPKIKNSTNELRVNSSNGISVEKNFVVFNGFTNDKYSYRQDYLDQINIKEAWEITGNNYVTVAVIDDGVYINHPDLLNNMWRNYDEIEGNGIDDDRNGYIDDVLGYNFVDNNAYMEVKGSHGTMVASIIGAIKDNGIGIAGIADKVKIMPIIVADNNGASFENIKKGIKYAINNGAKIINISLGTDKTIGFTNQFNNIIQEAYDNDIVVVIAAGNSDVDSGRIGINLNIIPETPICNNNNKQIILGVSALDNFDLNNNGMKKTKWSSYGSDCVNISAPGRFIVGATPPKYSSFAEFYGEKSGTSFSAPIVAGVVALIKSKYPNLKNWEIISRIINTADNIDKYNSGYKGQLGGRINVYKALTEKKIPVKIISVSPKKVKTGDKINIVANGYLLDYQFVLSSQNFKTIVKNNYIKAISANQFQITIPNNIITGRYGLSIKPKTTSIELDSLGDVLDITQILNNIIPDNQDVIIKNNDNIDNSNSQNVIKEEKSLITKIDDKLSKRMSGNILLQVEKNGEGWYVFPDNKKKYYLGRPADAFSIMRKLGLGATHEFITNSATFPDRVLGKILLDVEQNGEAYYIYPKDKKAYYLGRPSDAFQIMRNLGLGITNDDVRKIDIGEVE